jgi:hypothetical protein
MRKQHQSNICKEDVNVISGNTSSLSQATHTYTAEVCAGFIMQSCENSETCTMVADQMTLISQSIQSPAKKPA